MIVFDWNVTSKIRDLEGLTISLGNLEELSTSLGKNYLVKCKEH